MTTTARRISVSLAPLVLAALAALPGCASTSPRPAVDEVSETIRARSGATLRWDRQTGEDKETRDAIDRLLASNLTADAAVQIALLASPKLRSKLEALSITQADLVQAGLLKNPVFAIGRTAWETEHIDPNLFATVEQDFLDLLVLPLRKRVAATELEITKLDVGDHALELAAEVRRAFYSAQAAEQVATMRRLVEEAALTGAELAKSQHQAGNMSDLALNTELTLAAQATLDRHRSEGLAVVAREELTKHMGLWGPRTGWTLAPKLPELPVDEVPLPKLESRAIDQRLDIAALRREVQSLDYAVSLATTTRWIGAVTVHVEAGRLRDSKRYSFGPSVALEIPLFDQRQAAIARLEAIKRQREDDLHGVAIDVRADVRSTHARMLTARAVVNQYRTTLVPLREKIVKLSQQQYDAMLLGVYQLLQAKQAEYEAYREYIEALRDYWIARTDLERALGGRVKG